MLMVAFLFCLSFAQQKVNVHLNDEISVIEDSSASTTWTIVAEDKDTSTVLNIAFYKNFASIFTVGGAAAAASSLAVLTIAQVSLDQSVWVSVDSLTMTSVQSPDSTNFKSWTIPAVQYLRFIQYGTDANDVSSGWNITHDFFMQQ